MSSTRDFKSLGQWALNADTTIPASPTKGVAYRDTAFNEAQNNVGQEFKIKCNSAEWNQMLYSTTSLTDIIDSHGVLGWSDQVDYLGIDTNNYAIVYASDGKLYQSLLGSGPSGVDAKDPVSEPTFWEQQYRAADYANQTAGQEGSSLIGYTNQTVKQALDNLHINSILLAAVKYDHGTNTFYEGYNFNSGTVFSATSHYLEAELTFLVEVKNNSQSYSCVGKSEILPSGRLIISVPGINLNPNPTNNFKMNINSTQIEGSPTGGGSIAISNFGSFFLQIWSHPNE